MKKLFVLLWKDVLTEVRGLERLSTLALFSAAVLVTLHFSLPPASDARPKVAAGFLWAAIVFAAVIEFRRAFESERLSGTLDGLRAAPIDPTLIYVSKVVSCVIVLGLLASVLVPLTTLLFTGHVSGAPTAIGITLLGIVGLATWGTLFAAVAGGARAGEIVLPVLLFPLLVPQTIACVRLLAHTLTGERIGAPSAGFVLLAAFDVLAMGTSLLLFDYVLDE